jgi:hypothetical protein
MQIQSEHKIKFYFNRNIFALDLHFYYLYCYNICNNFSFSE